MSFNPKFKITPKINKALVEIERVRGFLDAVHLKKEWIEDIQKRALILEAHYSTHIEGTALTLEESWDLLEGKKVEGVNIDDKKELLNYKKAMDFVSKNLGKNNLFTEKIIRDVHKLTVKNVRGDKADPGSYRKVQNYIVNTKTKEVIYTPPSPLDVPPLMKELIDWLNTAKEDELSPVLMAAIAQFQFVHIHPFIDGNGRVGRLLSTLVLYKTGYDFKKLFTLSQYYDTNRLKYYHAIQSVRKNKMDMTSWLEYFVEGLREQMVSIQQKAESIAKGEVLLKKMESLGLNDRQIKALKYLIKMGKITVREYQDISKAIRRTAQRDLEDLEDKKIIKVVAKSSTDPTKYYILL